MKTPEKEDFDLKKAVPSPGSKKKASKTENEATKIGSETGEEVRFALEEPFKDHISESHDNTLEKLGNDCKKAWELLIARYPELNNLQIKLKKQTVEEIPCTIGSYFDLDYGTHGAIVLLGMEGNLNQQKIPINPTTPGVVITAELLGIESEKLTPELAKLFSFLHEVGHSLDYMENLKIERDQNKIKKWAKIKHSTDRKLQMRTLPIPGLIPAEIKYLIENEETDNLPSNIQERIKNGEAEKILEEQTKAYRELPSEKKADQFATAFMKEHFASKL